MLCDACIWFVELEQIRTKWEQRWKLVNDCNDDELKTVRWLRSLNI